jgi:aspartate aminotransferase-like enzyme
MEMSVANTTKRGDRILIASNGFFGDRFITICKKKDLEVDVIQAEWGKTVTSAEIEAQLGKHEYAAVTVTHVDTSTGVCAPVAEIGEMMKKFPNTIYIVDGVCATGAEFEDVDAMNIDVLFTGSQKAFGVCSGLMMLWASKKAVERRESLGEIPEYYCDFNMWAPIMDDPSKYFATPAINLVWALKKSVEIIEREGGLKARDERHRKNAKAMQAALEALGFKLLAGECCRAVTLSNNIYPDGIDDVKFRTTMAAEEGVVVAPGLAAYFGKMFRLGHMGNIDIKNEVAVLGAIERTLNKLGLEGKLGVGVAKYLELMA